MNRIHISIVALGAAVICAAAGCASSQNCAAFAQYDNATEVKVMELKRTSRVCHFADCITFKMLRPLLTEVHNLWYNIFVVIKLSYFCTYAH